MIRSSKRSLAHFYLSEAFIRAVAKLDGGNAYALKGRYGRPEDYLDDDARILQYERLTRDHLKSYHESKKIDNIETKLPVSKRKLTIFVSTLSYF